MRHFSRLDRLSWVAAIGAGVGLIIASLYLPGGDDLYRYYLPFAKGCLDCGYMPYFAQWFLFPLRLFPDYPIAWPLWTFFSVSGFLTLAYISQINPLLLMISFPMLGQIWLGQVDFLIALGLFLFLFAKSPYIRGFGLILALTKPQLTALPIFFCLLLESPRSYWKPFIVPAIVLLSSFVIYSWHWPIQWLTHAFYQLPIHVWRLASRDIWPFGIFLLPLPMIFRKRRTRLTAGLLIASLATPFYGVYSYVLFLLFDAKWWSVLLSYAWMIALIFQKESAMRFAWVLPVGILLHMVSSEWDKKDVQFASDSD